MFHFSLQTRKSKRHGVISIGNKLGQQTSQVGGIELQFLKGVNPHSRPYTADGNIQQPQKYVLILNITGYRILVGQAVIFEIGIDKGTIVLRVDV
jgi:putative N-acetylmannosamine-6-phosphate epimerase